MRSPTFWHALRFATEGLVYVVRTQRNARIHLAILALVIGAGLYFRLTPIEWGLIALVSGWVLSLEALNSSIEVLVDMVQPRHHPDAKVVKDTAAGAVLLAAITAVIIGAIVFVPRVWAMALRIAGMK